MTLPSTPHSDALPPDAQPPSAYETSDVNIRALLWLAARSRRNDADEKLCRSPAFPLHDGAIGLI